jgi:hypothetical protein
VEPVTNATLSFTQAPPQCPTEAGKASGSRTHFHAIALAIRSPSGGCE